MSNFSKNWEAPPKKVSAPSGPLKPQIENAIRLIQTQMQRLDIEGSKLGEKDRALFNKVVDYYSKHDMDRARICANELSEVRKLSKRVLQMKLALESIQLRLVTVKDYGDILGTVNPALSLIKNLKGGVAQIVPEAEKGFASLGESLSSIVSEAGQASGLDVTFEATNDEALKIMNDAAIVAEQKIKDKFPDLPADVYKEGVQL